MSDQAADNNWKAVAWAAAAEQLTGGEVKVLWNFQIAAGPLRDGEWFISILLDLR